jgi:hypothetical protein
MIFSKNEARAELYLSRPRAVENKWFFDQLELEREEIECSFGTELQWQRLDDKKACRICLRHPFDGYDDENWPEMVNWLCKYIVKLEEAFSEPLGRLNELMKSQGDAYATSENEPS